MISNLAFFCKIRINIYMAVSLLNDDSQHIFTLLKYPVSPNLPVKSNVFSVVVYSCPSGV